jgi:hypothetical protein
MTTQQEPRWFDEGPRPVTIVKPSNRTLFTNVDGIDTTDIDAFRQGVELTQPKHASQGLVKLGTGDPGGRLVQGFYGMSGLPAPGPFVEDEAFAGQDLTTDGAVEPLALRALAGGDDARSSSGTVMGGTEDCRGRSPLVESQHELSQAESSPPYVDGSDSVGTVPVPGQRLQQAAGRLAPAADDASKSGTRIPSGADPALAAALRAMSPATDTYVRVGWKSAATGWTYGTPDNVDSIAFGGQDR